MKRRAIIIIFVGHPIFNRALLNGLLGSGIVFTETEAVVLAGLEVLEVEAVGGGRLCS